MSDVLRISPDEPVGDGRFDRFGLIGWWDQVRLTRARVLVVGAGALGNEIVKNLALLGVGNLLIADMDRIENSNLSRSVLYRESDNGQYKSIAAARAARDIYPDIKAHAFVGNVVHDLGLGAFRWADVVLGGLDNREARLAINRNCWKVNRPWIDGAIEAIDGSARVFVPDGPCYECTMSQQDWKLLQTRRSCNLLSLPEMERGKTPTTPTVSSIIAGVQCQEAVKLLHGLNTLAGGAWVFNGLTADSYITRFQRKADCYSHDKLDDVIALDGGVADVTAADLLARAKALLGDDARLEMPREMLEKLACPACKAEEPVFASLGKVSADKAWCPSCAGVRREVITFHTIRGDEPFARRPLEQIGVPPYDILVARGHNRSIGFELSGDAPAVLGPLVSDDALEFA
ncbi:MAG: ThiF family adenylyltransferase [Tepidisphaeraceae bacterium]